MDEMRGTTEESREKLGINSARRTVVYAEQAQKVATKQIAKRESPTYIISRLTGQ